MQNQFNNLIQMFMFSQQQFDSNVAYSVDHPSSHVLIQNIHIASSFQKHEYVYVDLTD